MSVGLCGCIYFDGKDVYDEIEFSYYVMEQATKSRIGCKLGGNISQNAYERLENALTKSMILLEIMDTCA